jgi:drug/metabolite transporter (DMT)-like permease
MSNHRLGAICVLGAAILWSTAGLFMGFLEQLDAWTILFWRSVFGTVFVGVAALASLGATPRLANPGYSWLVATVCSALAMLAFIPALRLTSVANVAMIHASLPILSALAAAVGLRERPSRAMLCFSVLALIGTAVIFLGSVGRSSNQFGNLLAFLMTASLAIMTAALRTHKGSVLSIVAASNAAAAAVALCLSPGVDLDLTQACILALFALLQMAMGLALYSKGASLLPSADAALLSLIEVPLSPLWVWLAFDHPPSGPSVLGGLIIGAAAAGSIVTRLWRGQEDETRRQDSVPGESS